MISTLRAMTTKITCNSASAITQCQLGPMQYFEDITGKQHFQAGDNLNILSIGLSVPGFVQLLDNTFLTNTAIPMFIDFDVPGPDPIFANIMPFSPYELAIGQFIDLSSVATQFRISAAYYGGLPYVATGIIPSIMNGTVIGINVFLKVEHNLPMVP
jgi:hypothetical protein